MNAKPDDAPNDLYHQQVENLRLQNRELQLRIDKAMAESSPEKQPSPMAKLVPMAPVLTWAVTALSALGAAGVWAWNANKAREDEKKAIEARNDQKEEEQARVLAAPFLTKQFELYMEAVQCAAVISTSDDPARVKAAEARFWELYWGQLASVEDAGLRHATGGAPEESPIESAMVAFAQAMEEKKNGQSDPLPLKVSSLNLAHAVRSVVSTGYGLKHARETKAREANAEKAKREH